MSKPLHLFAGAAGLLPCLGAALVAQGVFASLGEPVAVAGDLFFVADRSPQGGELWILEAGHAAARLVKDIHAGPASSAIGTILPLGGKAVFVATDGERGRELWISDGTAPGTTLLRDLAAGAAGSGVDLVHGAAVVGSTLYFFAYDGDGNGALWKSDGTAAGTAAVRPFPGGGAAVAYHHRMTPLPGGVVVFRMPGTHGDQVWRSDGTARGTLRLHAKASAKGTGPYARIGGELFFTAGTEQAWAVWRTDATPEGTKQLIGAGAVVGAVAAAGAGKIGGPRPTAASRKLARVHFLTYCATCHGKTGRGDGPAAIALNPKPRNWTDAKWQASVTDQRILKVVRDGGASVGLSPMMAPNPMYGKNPAVLKALVEMIRRFDGKR